MTESSAESNKVFTPGLTEADRQKRILDLVDEIKRSADGLHADGSSRGDLKILARAVHELRYAFKVFSPYRRRRKVTVFGSARTRPDEPAYIHAVEFARRMAEQNWLVVTGAASGIMEAGHRGAGREHSMGLNIMLPFEQSANPIIAGDSKLVNMKHFFTRKLMFVKECDAVVRLPGGFGTLYEAMAVITLLQTGKRDMVPVVLLNAPGDNYWEHLHQFILDQLLAKRMISPEDLSLYKVTDNVDEAVREVLEFFRVYHSMRYVRDRLVLRMQEPLTPKLFSAIRQEFSDILAPGGETTLIADITPQPNMHVYAPGQEGYIPIGLAINRTNTFRTSPPAFPDPEPYFFAPLKQTVNVFSKPFRITSVLTIGRSPDIDRRAAAGDTVRVAGRLTYQACDDAVCYRSETLPVMWVVGLRKH